MSISDSSLTVDVWTEIKNLIVSANPIITNSTTGTTTLASVRAAYNDEKNSRPQIVISPANPDKKNDKFGQTVSAKLINIMIDCYAANTLGADQLYDQVLYKIESTPISGIELVGITTDSPFNIAADSKYHVKSLILTYDRE